MNFHLSDDQIALQDAVRSCVRGIGKGQLHRAAFDSADGHAPEFRDGLVALGALGVGIDQDYGGLGLKLVDLALVCEVLGQEAAPGGYTGHVLAALAVQVAGSPEQKQRWLPRLADGSSIATVALGGAQGWEPEDWTLRVEDSKLNGAGGFAVGADAADLVVVGLAGGGLTIVEMAPPSVTITPLDGSDRSRRLFDLHFTDAVADPLPIAAGPRIYDALLVLLCADAFGGASRVMELTADYARTRVQFGRPIGGFQGVKHQLANLLCEVEPCRGLLWYAALCFDLDLADRSRTIALAKAHLADRYMHMARSAIELHGGIGYTWEYDLQIWVKRAMFDFAYGGTPGVLRQRAVRLGCLD
ncbi:acyl-CoA dehydrogenase family protein [Sphingobium sp. Sx8-8]|uniref:acyl-CoA dehydrogenase family protein n=1 Tax=Sphingobium sp. Sx8-8 TaxID=2933617 RepID=UPI001F55E989|nr:acyl-CoA dehydrogenase family protein [Sphingobium sp. Sx8-8]